MFDRIFDWFPFNPTSDSPTYRLRSDIRLHGYRTTKCPAVLLSVICLLKTYLCYRLSWERSVRSYRPKYHLLERNVVFVMCVCHLLLIPCPLWSWGHVHWRTVCDLWSGDLIKKTTFSSWFLPHLNQIFMIYNLFSEWSSDSSLY
jgi:hypothetical protein